MYVSKMVKWESEVVTGMQNKSHKEARNVFLSLGMDSSPVRMRVWFYTHSSIMYYL